MGKGYEKIHISTTEKYKILDPNSGEEKGILEEETICADGYKVYTAMKMWKPGNYHIKVYFTKKSAIKYIME